MVKNQLVEVQCRQDGCDAGRQGAHLEIKGGKIQTPLSAINILFLHVPVLGTADGPRMSSLGGMKMTCP